MTRLIDQLHELTSRYVYKAFDAVLTSRVAEDVTAGVPRTSVSNYRLVHTMVTAANRVAPPLMRKVARWIERYDQLPFAASEVSLLSFGTGTTVFLVHREDSSGSQPPLVLKVVRRSLGLRMHTLLAQIQEYRMRYHMVAQWYADCHLIVPLQFLILRGPLLALPAIAALQPLVDDERWDLFEFGSDEELLELFRAHHALREQFCCFATRTDAVVASTSRCVDFVGRDNLLLVRTSDGFRLQLIDYGVLDLRRLATASSTLLAKAQERLARVRRLHVALAEETDGAESAAIVQQET